MDTENYSKKRKLLFFHHYISCMGAGLCLLHILKSLDREKFTAVIYLPPMPGDLKSAIEDLGFPVKESEAVVPYMHFSGSRTAFFDPRHLANLNKVRKSAPRIRQIIAEEKPDLVLVNSLTLCWMGRLAHLNGIKAICFDRETFRKGWLGVRTAWMKKCLRNDFDGVAFISDYDMRETGRGKGVFRRITDKVDISLYDGMNQAALRSELQLPADKKLLLYLGGSNYLKGADVVVQALAELEDKNVCLVYMQFQKENPVSGRAKLKAALRRLLGQDYQKKVLDIARKNRLMDQIIFRPGTRYPEKYVVASDIVVFPSRLVHQARPVYEAGIARRPCIITDFVNTQEFANEKTAWRFPVGDAAALADCIRQILWENTSLAEERVNNNRRQCEQVNDLSDLKQEITDLIEQVFGC